MAARRPQRPAPVAGLALPSVADEATQRALDELAGAVRSLQAARGRALITVDLVVGTNKIAHGLGRAAAAYAITPTVASAAFAHAINLTNPHPEHEVWIDVLAVAQPGARVEVF